MGPGAWRGVLDVFYQDAGPLIVGGIRAVLGQTELYTLSERYKIKKVRLRRFRRIAGKDPYQPIIFSGELYDAVRARRDGKALVVEVDPGKAVDAGFDYAEAWQSGEGFTHGRGVDFLGKGLNVVENSLDDILLTTIFREMRL